MTKGSQETTVATNSQELDSTAPNQEENLASEETVASPEFGQAEDDGAIPQKFVGKSLQDIARSYSELEKFKGKIDSERTQYKTELEELRAKYAALEQERQQAIPAHAQHVQHTAQQEEADPLSEFESAFDSDPKEAIKKLGKKLLGETRGVATQAILASRAEQAAAFYHQQMKDNSDFRELEPDMRRLAQKYSTFLRPEVANTKETVELLYKLARAENESKFIQRAQEAAKKSSELVREEKRKAFSESSNSQGDAPSVSIDDLTAEELARLLPRSGPKY